ncbi:MAG: hypothetical protein N2109_07525, partial [Fimbriimonadales bacterium]|nr:hypothetical protein [Fimbriimonadales bacterium]
MSLIGDRKEGYCRFGSPGTLGFQVRWKHARRPGRLKDALFAYFRLLQKESRRAGKAFESEMDEDGDRISYQWRGHAKATGQLLYSPVSQRVFFLELMGERKDSLGLFGQIAGSFRALDPDGPDRWTVLGLSVRLPKRANLDSRSFHAGRTVLH